MFYRFLGISLVFILLFQIVFSFYYSSEVINQNNIMDQNQSQFELLSKENEDLEKRLSDLNSLYQLQTKISLSSYTQITQKFNLNTP